MPPDAPIEQYWPTTVYDRETARFVHEPDQLHPGFDVGITLGLDGWIVAKSSGGPLVNFAKLG